MDDPAPQRVVIDLRRNGGGNNFLLEALRKRIERSRFNRPGSLYVMISPRTFSAAQNAANRLERETFALFVGEPSGRAQNHFGDAQTTVGAATGITTHISTLPWFDSYPPDKRVWIMPDLPSPACSRTGGMATIPRWRSPWPIQATPRRTGGARLTRSTSIRALSGAT
jgi:hypothetical protein